MKRGIIGISGKIGSGKDTFASLYGQQSQYTWEIKKFAFKLKQIVSLLTNIPVEELEKEEIKNAPLGDNWQIGGYGPLTPRKMLQLIGTEGGRDLIHPQIWVNSLFADLKEDSNWLITDVRFPNEAEAIKKSGGTLIRINRLSDKVSNHPSETSLDDYDGWDRVIDNNGTLQDLNEIVSKIVDL